MNSKDYRYHEQENEKDVNALSADLEELQKQFCFVVKKRSGWIKNLVLILLSAGFAVFVIFITIHDVKHNGVKDTNALVFGIAIQFLLLFGIFITNLVLFIDSFKHREENTKRMFELSQQIEEKEKQLQKVKLQNNKLK